MKRYSILLFLLLMICVLMSACGSKEDGSTVVLRVCNWEEYIDEGGWDEDERIDLDNGVSILGEEKMYHEFEEWYKEKYGVDVKVEYSCFGTNEDLYNMLTIGDRFDLVCPSDYMIMKLMAEHKLVPYSDSFYDVDNELNYYSRGVSDYIRDIFDDNKIGGEPWSLYAAGYMWGNTGIVYNPEYMTKEEASEWKVLQDRKFHRQITIKDNVRDSYFAAIAIHKADLLRDDAFTSRKDYTSALAAEVNDTSDESIQVVESILKDIKENAYSIETDSGKADMITGKVVASYQWSGDAVYAIEQAEEDGVDLCFEVPKEGGNLWFDGWVMLKDGIAEDPRKQAAAEAFVNYISRSDNVVRNMYYIGYTSVMAGEEGDSTIYDYANWCYGVDEEDLEDEEEIADSEDVDEKTDEGADEGDEDEEIIEYDVSYFFDKNGSGKSFIIEAPEGAQDGGLGSQYPTLDVIRRCAVMSYFDDQTNEKINQMWTNVRCFNIYDLKSWF